MSVSCLVCVQFVSGFVFGLVSGFVSGSRPGSCPGSCLIHMSFDLIRVCFVSGLCLIYIYFIILSDWSITITFSSYLIYIRSNLF